MLFDQAHSLLGATLLMRTDREAKVARGDRAVVLGQDDLAAGQRDALAADQDVHERTRALSGSNTGIESLVTTVTGYRSPMYSTLSCSPTTECSGGR